MSPAGPADTPRPPPGPAQPAEPDWAALARLRAVFLGEEGRAGDYWPGAALLADYDRTFGRRIRWKWDYALGELRARGWAPPVPRVLDWGCGTGVAARAFLEWFAPDATVEVVLSDRSPAAVQWAAQAVSAEFPRARPLPCPTAEAPERARGAVVLLSHVANELGVDGAAAVDRLLAEAAAVVWVEPGQVGPSRHLVAARERWRDRFVVLAPCTHQAACGLLHPAHQLHWCHHFAHPPPEVFTDPFWAEFSHRLGIDLRALPLSFLALARPPVATAPPAGWSRLLGRPREYKGYARLLDCAAEGVRELLFQERSDRALFKRLRKGRARPLYRWTLQDGRPSAGSGWQDPAPEPE